MRISPFTDIAVLKLHCLKQPRMIGRGKRFCVLPPRSFFRTEELIGQACGSLWPQLLTLLGRGHRKWAVGLICPPFHSTIQNCGRLLHKTMRPSFSLLQHSILPTQFFPLFCIQTHISFLTHLFPPPFTCAFSFLPSLLTPLHLSSIIYLINVLLTFVSCLLLKP